eukprot:Hpha_TRINITY_DN4959_c0_g1::TRINITY_DN4959_c0_g1_i1::g.51492::m.51492
MGAVVWRSALYLLAALCAFVGAARGENTTGVWWEDTIPGGGTVLSVATGLRGTKVAVGTENGLWVYHVETSISGVVAVSRQAVSRGLDNTPVRAVAISAESGLLAAACDSGNVHLFQITQWRSVLALGVVISRPAEAKGDRVGWSGPMPQSLLQGASAVTIAAGGQALVVSWGATVAVFGLRLLEPFASFNVEVLSAHVLQLSDYREETGRAATLAHGVALSGDALLMAVVGGDSSVRGMPLQNADDSFDQFYAHDTACVWDHYEEGRDYQVYVREYSQGFVRLALVTIADLYNENRNRNFRPFPEDQCVQLCLDSIKDGSACGAVEYPVLASSVGFSVPWYCGLWYNGRCRSPVSPGITRAKGYDLIVMNRKNSPIPAPPEWDPAEHGEFDACRREVRSKLARLGAVGAEKFTCHELTVKDDVTFLRDW